MVADLLAGAWRRRTGSDSANRHPAHSAGRQRNDAAIRLLARIGFNQAADYPLELIATGQPGVFDVNAEGLGCFARQRVGLEYQHGNPF